MIGSFRQSMTWLHTWAGLVVCWILYFMFVTGTVGYFYTEIDRWMQPDRPVAMDASFSEAVAVGRAHLEREGAGADRWFINPPRGREIPHLRTFWQKPAAEDGGDIQRGNDELDMRTGETVPESVRETGGGQTLYRMHYILHYLNRDIAYRLVGILTLIMFIGMVTGIVVHKKIFKDFFTFRFAKGQRSWLDMHNLFSVTSLPFQLMITYSGLIFMVTTWMPLVAIGSYNFDTEKAAEVISEATGEVSIEAAGVPAELVAFEPVIARAEQAWGDDSLMRMEVRHPGDANARIIVYRKENASRVPARMVFDGVSGEVLDGRTDYVSTPIVVAATFLGLHEGLFAGPVLRWLYFLSGLLGTAMIATGAIYWTAKRRNKNPDEPEGRGFRFVECLNIGTVVGLPIGIAAYFLANRLLPLGMENRAEWEVHVMFIVWGLTLLYPVLRSRVEAWREQAWLAAAAFAAIPVVNVLTTDNAHLLVTLPAGDWVLAGFDLTAIAAAVLFVVAALLIGRYRPRSHQSVEAAAERGDATAQSSAVA
ncbi:MAG: PepSY-associated TM helix domain-containing protein [Pseudomonadota bacterium]